MAAPVLELAPHRKTMRTDGPLVCAFIEAACVHGEGDWFGQPFRLRPWQRDIIYRLFELRWDEERRQWRRRYRRALIGLPSGAGKTELAAALAHFFLLGQTHRSPLVVISAASKGQAGLVYGAARAMSEESAILKKYTDAGVDAITLRGQPGRMQRVSAADGTNDGQRPSCLIADELHEWSESKNTFQVLTKGTAKRVDSMQIYISTAGWDKDTICGRLYEHGKKMQRNEVRDDGFFFYWREAPEGADADAEATWRAAHPAAGDFMSIEALREKRNEMPDPVFRRYFLNQWTEVQNAWLKAGQWQACERKAEAALEPGLPTFIAWDAATEDDSTAIVAGQLYEREEVDEDGDTVRRLRLRLVARIWERPINPATNKPLEKWQLPIGQCLAYLRELNEAHDVKAIGFDPQFVSWEANELEGEGLPMAKFPQSPGRMAEASQMLYSRIAREEITHSGDPAFARHIRNAVAEQLKSGSASWRLVKGKAKRKMDATVAAAMVAWIVSKYEEQPAAAAPGSYTGDYDADHDWGDEDQDDLW